ncbi:PLP-dependent aminotransferase family protein [Roseateles sp.]|uniref:aminotransferase-like domain-containing protein n=1 Tax=Roseateles sp. TaxID=1971397 RepID=UPI0031DD965D
MKLYEKLANDIERQIRGGVLRHGDRLQSVRQTSRQCALSVTTVLRAYLLLESRGLLISKPQSGYFVQLRPGSDAAEAAADAVEAITTPKPMALSATVDVSRLVLSTLRSIAAHDAVPLGSPYPDTGSFPLQKLNRYAYAAGQDPSLRALQTGLPPGHPQLIRQIAKRYLDKGQTVDPAEILITLGATEAINLCLQAVAKPGDVIAVESPTFYAMLHAIERMGMKAIEVPTHPEHGIDVDALAGIAASQAIAACMVMPNFQNPLGFVMPDERKQTLVELATRLDMPLIENGVYNELYYGAAPPRTLKSYDREGLVLHCGTFSKTLTSIYRIGWALPGRYRDQVEKLKFLNTLTTPPLPQMAIARFLTRDGYEAHLRRLRKAYAQQASLMRAIVLRFFPEGTRVSTPRGGYVLWIEMPPQVDAMRLYELALARGITIGPGHMFSVSDRYRHFIRLNYSTPWSPAIERAVITVGKLAADCMR